MDLLEIAGGVEQDLLPVIGIPSVEKWTFVTVNKLTIFRSPICNKKYAILTQIVLFQ